MKKQLGTSCVALTIFAPFALAASGFSDVAPSSSFHQAINVLREERILSGFPDGSFRPNQDINRAEFTKIIIGALTRQEDAPECYTAEKPLLYVRLKDVGRQEWYSPWLCHATRFDIISGYPDSTFRPSNPVNFAEAAKIIARASNLDLGTDPVWYRPAVEYLAREHAIPVTVRGPDHRLTRGEMAEIIYRVRNQVESKPSLSAEALLPNDGVSTSEAKSTDRFEYYLHHREEQYRDSTPIDDDYFDASLIRRARATGEEETLVESIRRAIPDLRLRPNYTLVDFAHPSHSDTIYLQWMYMDTDAGAGPLYAVDVSAEPIEFSRMRINDLGLFTHLAGQLVLSPDHDRFVWIPNGTGGDSKVMYLVDLLADSYQPLLTLSGNETLNAAFTTSDFGIGTNAIDVGWEGPSSVRFAVYDQSRKGGKDPHAALMGHRIVTVPD